MRAALGASRGRLIRQFLTESLLLALAGGSPACCSRRRSSMASACSAPQRAAARRDRRQPARCWLFTVAVSLDRGVLFGLVPALASSRSGLHASWAGGPRHARRAARVWGRGAACAGRWSLAELALSVMLLIGAGLLIRSFARLQHVSPGFNAADVLTFELTLTGPRYPDAEARDRAPIASSGRGSARCPA